MKVDFSHNAIEALPAFTFADFPFPGWYFLDLSFNRMRSYANNTNQEEVQCQIQAESLQPSVRVAWDPQTPSAQYGSAQPRGRRPFFQHAECVCVWNARGSGFLHPLQKAIPTSSRWPAPPGILSLLGLPHAG